MATKRPDPDTEVITALRAAGHRVTPQRLLIHRALRERDRHVSADDVHDAVSAKLPALSLPTVYATLELFEDMGLVRRIDAGRGAALFDPRSDAHQHAVCRRCGRVEDVEVDVDVAPALAAARGSGFAPDAGEVVVRGLCAACRAAPAWDWR
jgi:Fe2+ or Zn2+ uptake regulation protein